MMHSILDEIASEEAIDLYLESSLISDDVGNVVIDGKILNFHCSMMTKTKIAMMMTTTVMPCVRDETSSNIPKSTCANGNMTIKTNFSKQNSICENPGIFPPSFRLDHISIRATPSYILK